MAISLSEFTPLSNQGGATSYAMAAKAVTAASAILVVTWAPGRGFIPSGVSDNQSNSYLLINTADGTDHSGTLKVWLAQNCAAGSTTITVTTNSDSISNLGIYAVEVLGASIAAALSASSKHDCTEDGGHTTTIYGADSPGLSVPAGAYAFAFWNIDRSSSPSGPTGWSTLNVPADSTFPLRGMYKSFPGGGSNERAQLTVSTGVHYDAFTAVIAAEGGGGSSSGAARNYYSQL